MIVFGAPTSDYGPLQADGSLRFQVKESYVENERSGNLETSGHGVIKVVLTVLNFDGSKTAIDQKSLTALTFGKELIIEISNSQPDPIGFPHFTSQIAGVIFSILLPRGISI